MVRIEQLSRNDFLHAPHRDHDLWRRRESFHHNMDRANDQSVFVFTCVWGFLVASFPRYAASAMAGNTLVRCLWAAGFPLFADPVRLPLSLSIHACQSLILDVPRTRCSQSDKYPSWSSSCNGTNPIRTLLLRIKVEESIDVFKVRTIHRMNERICILSSDTDQPQYFWSFLWFIQWSCSVVWI